MLEHDPEKWAAVFRKDHAQTTDYRQVRFAEIESDLSRELKIQKGTNP
jgi:hypothetical protein